MKGLGTQFLRVIGKEQNVTRLDLNALCVCWSLDYLLDRLTRAKFQLAFFLIQFTWLKPYYCLNGFKLILVLVQGKCNKDSKLVVPVF